VADAPAVPGFRARLQDRMEEWVYRLNEQDHWIFRLWDRANELAARVLFRGGRRLAMRLDVMVQGRDRAARVRALGEGDLDALADLLARLDAKYGPPHASDRATAARALARQSYTPYGIFVDGEMIGYVLHRFFLPRRMVTGIWMVTSSHNAGIGRVALVESMRWLGEARLDTYCTVPIDNLPSLRIAQVAGFRLIRTNRRFHVLIIPHEHWGHSKA
jgi:RimJ/RimL family protein N-acetyltransferase